MERKDVGASTRIFHELWFPPKFKKNTLTKQAEQKKNHKDYIQTSKPHLPWDALELSSVTRVEAENTKKINTKCTVSDRPKP